MKLLKRFQSKKQLNESPGQSDNSTAFNAAHAILAFRTITTMLSLIQSPTEITSTGEKDLSKEQRDKLRVLDALSAVIVRQHEIAAVMAKPSNGDKIEVLASVNHLDPTFDIPQLSDSRLDRLRWLITPNPRDPLKNKKSKIDSLTTRATSVTLVDTNTKISEKLSTADSDKLLDTFLLNEWGNESFDTHIWMLKTLLGRSGKDTKTLQLYIIAASIPKMLYRMERHISTCYFDCLTNMKLTTFDFPEPPHMATTRSNDSLFIEILSQLIKFMDIPNLQLAKGAEVAETPCEIYNKETYVEFHRVLCELLKSFHKSLTKLHTCRGEMLEKGMRDAGDLLQIREYLNDVRVWGRSLRAMVSGAAIEKHLKTIAHLLEVDDGKSPSTTEEDTDVGATTEEDTEFDALRPYSIHHNQPLLPWQSYKDWLKLMVIYFDAAYILSGHITRLVKRRSISTDIDFDIDIKILAPSLPTQKMLPWKELLLHEIYFPELPRNPEQPSAAELVKFLTSNFDAVTEGTRNESEERITIKRIVSEGKGRLQKRKTTFSIEEVLRLVKNLKEQQELAVAVDTTAIDLVIERMSSLNNCSSPGWGEYTSTIIEQLKALKRPELTRPVRLVQMRGIVEMFETLRGHSLLYQQLKKDTPLALGDRFPGSRHCEVCIASFNSLSAQLPNRSDLSQYKEILCEFEDTGQLIGVSKRCCPVCARLLDLLETCDKKKFLTTGGHSTVTPCTLPEWLPDHIIKEMVVEFGRRLRVELVKLQQRTEVLRGRTSSTDTRRISVDSVGSKNESIDNDGFEEAFTRALKAPSS